MKQLKIFQWLVWAVLGFNVSTLILGLMTGGSLWWLALIGALIAIGTLLLNKKTMRLRAKCDAEADKRRLDFEARHTLVERNDEEL